MNKKLNSVPSDGTKDDKRTAADVSTSSPNAAKPHVIGSGGQILET